MYTNTLDTQKKLNECGIDGQVVLEQVATARFPSNKNPKRSELTFSRADAGGALGQFVEGSVGGCRIDFRVDVMPLDIEYLTSVIQVHSSPAADDDWVGEGGPRMGRNPITVCINVGSDGVPWLEVRAIPNPLGKGADYSGSAHASAFPWFPDDQQSDGVNFHKEIFEIGKRYSIYYEYDPAYPNDPQSSGFDHIGYLRVYINRERVIWKNGPNTDYGASLKQRLPGKNGYSKAGWYVQINNRDDLIDKDFVMSIFEYRFDDGVNSLYDIDDFYDDADEPVIMWQHDGDTIIADLDEGDACRVRAYTDQSNDWLPVSVLDKLPDGFKWYGSEGDSEGRTYRLVYADVKPGEYKIEFHAETQDGRVSDDKEYTIIVAQEQQTVEQLQKRRADLKLQYDNIEKAIVEVTEEIETLLSDKS